MGRNAGPSASGATVELGLDYEADLEAAEFAVGVKEVKAKQVPALDDDLAIEAGGFDTLDDLKNDLRERMLQGKQAIIILPASRLACSRLPTVTSTLLPPEAESGNDAPTRSERPS